MMNRREAFGSFRDSELVPTSPDPAEDSELHTLRGEPILRTGDDRRRDTRMRPFNPARRPVDDPLRDLLPRRWRLMAPTLAGVLLLTAVTSWSLPDLVSLLAATIAIAAGVVGPAQVTLQGALQRLGWPRYPLLLASIALPMVLAGFALARWAALSPAVDWPEALGALAVLSLAAAALLNGRMISNVAAKLGLWVAPALYIGNWQVELLLLVGAVLGLAIAAREMRRMGEETEARAEREREQVRAEELLAEFEETRQGWFWETDRRGQVAYVSRPIADLLGKSQAELEGRPFTDMFVLDARGGNERTLLFHLSTRSSFQELQVRAATKECEERWWSISGRPVLDQYDNFLGFRGSGSDLTETRKSEQHVVELARFDSLTKLANRFQMAEWLEKILEAPRDENKTCAVFLLDLDRFKQVNDTMGHPAGDVLLKQVADRLRSTVGSDGRVGRLGGDEFQVILPGRAARDQLAHLANHIIESLSQPYSIDGSRVTIGASIGVALSPDDGSTSEELIRNADLALYAAKDGGRGRHHFYAQDLHSDARERQQLEQDLRDAIAQGALELHYQPQVQVTTEKITGFEALLRWKHPRMGYISPAKFVPIAEDAGLIPVIGEWALRTACHDMAKWPPEVRVAVNVSPLQFANPALPAIVTSALAASGVAASRLELEITESVFLGDDAKTQGMFKALKRVGVRLALDDFGTGYSSLGYLRSFPFDKIKVDRGFISDLPNGKESLAIVRAVAGIGRSLGITTTVEGVETQEQLDAVNAEGFDEAQGYLFSRPVPAHEIVDALRALGAG